MTTGIRVERGGPFELRPFTWAADDSRASTHELIHNWIEEAYEVKGATYYRDIDLKETAAGRQLAALENNDARVAVLVLLEHLKHWHAELERIRSQAKTSSERVNAHTFPGWDQVWGRARSSNSAIAALLRRKLPLTDDDLLSLLQWINSLDQVGQYNAPVASTVRAIEMLARARTIGDPLRREVGRFADRLQQSVDKQLKRQGMRTMQAIGGSIDMVDEPADDMPRAAVASRPAPVGSPLVLRELKAFMGVIPSLEMPATTIEGPDEYALPADSPLCAEHQLLSRVFNEVIGTHHYDSFSLDQLAAGREILAMAPRDRGRCLLAATERAYAASQPRQERFDRPHAWQSRYAVLTLINEIARTELELDREALFDVLLSFSRLGNCSRYGSGPKDTTSQLQQMAAQSPFSNGERYVIHRLRASLINAPPMNVPGDEVLTLTRLLGDGLQLYLVPGEYWSDAVNNDVTSLTSLDRAKWHELLTHAMSAAAARPSTKWINTAAKLLEKIGHDTFTQALLDWLPQVNRGRSLPVVRGGPWDSRDLNQLLDDGNATCLRGLIWMSSLVVTPDLVRRLSELAISSYRKVAGVGPRATKVGNACVFVLGQQRDADAIAQLALLKVKVKFGTAQKEIEKAFNQAAEALQLPRDEIEEMAVPAYGLEEVGLRREVLAEHVVKLRVDGSDVTLAWFKPDGKPIKSVPAKVKAQCKDDVKELQQAVKDIAAMLPAQRERIDQLFLQQKTWAYATWAQRYLDHPLVGTIARRLIWVFDDGVAKRAATWLDGRLVDAAGEPVAVNQEAAIVSLWHPIGESIESVQAWRRFFEDRQIRQPFKQAHREVYLLTDAERNTGVYSNRFAAHILKQHQFNALCAARGWKNKLRLMVDDEYPPAFRLLASWGIRAEYWIEGAGSEYGADTNETGTYLYLTTDQVRFYRMDAQQVTAHAGGGGYHAGWRNEAPPEPLPLDQVPPLVFSEIMRDVDLFVGVASVGNDPAWGDSGVGEERQNYWRQYSFGDLSATAQTRKGVLERLVPRLKIAQRCSLSDKFLVVRGELRTYKIHLGSGNILMEPNDQYLCIVPKASAATSISTSGGGGGGGGVFLPFEGDRTMAIVLSKAFLLAADTKITDPTIVSQIGRAVT